MRWRRLLNEQTLLFLLSLALSISLWAYLTSVRAPSIPQAATKVVAVVPAIRGEPAFGFSLVGIRITPQTVVLFGAPEVLAQIESVTTEPVDIRGADRSFTQQVAVTAPAEVRVSERVRVAVQVVETMAVTTIREIRVQQPQAPPGLVVDIQPETVQVQVQGPVRVVNGLRATDFTAMVDGLDFSEGRQLVSVKVQAPAQVEVLGITPTAVTVTVRKGS